MSKRTIHYEYPPQSRSRRGPGGGLRVHQCMNCGRFGGVQADATHFKCFFCKTTTEFVNLEPGQANRVIDRE